VSMRPSPSEPGTPRNRTRAGIYSVTSLPIRDYEPEGKFRHIVAHWPQSGHDDIGCRWDILPAAFTNPSCTWRPCRGKRQQLSKPHGTSVVSRRVTVGEKKRPSGAPRTTVFEKSSSNAGVLRHRQMRTSSDRLGREYQRRDVAMAQLAADPAIVAQA
jgi:hypothetical protein